MLPSAKFRYVLAGLTIVSTLFTGLNVAQNHSLKPVVLQLADYLSTNTDSSSKGKSNFLLLSPALKETSTSSQHWIWRDYQVNMVYYFPQQPRLDFASIGGRAQAKALQTRGYEVYLVLFAPPDELIKQDWQILQTFCRPKFVKSREANQLWLLTPNLDKPNVLLNELTSTCL